MDSAVIVDFDDDVFLPAARKLAVELVGVVVLLEIEARHEGVMPITIGMITGMHVASIVVEEPQGRDEAIVGRAESREEIGVRHVLR